MLNVAMHMLAWFAWFAWFACSNFSPLVPGFAIKGRGSDEAMHSRLCQQATNVAPSSTSHKKKKQDIQTWHQIAAPERFESCKVSERKPASPGTSCTRTDLGFEHQWWKAKIWCEHSEFVRPWLHALIFCPWFIHVSQHRAPQSGARKCLWMQETSLNCARCLKWSKNLCKVPIHCISPTLTRIELQKRISSETTIILYCFQHFRSCLTNFQQWLSSCMLIFRGGCKFAIISECSLLPKALQALFTFCCKAQILLLWSCHDLPKPSPKPHGPHPRRLLTSQLGQAAQFFFLL